jgi:hypothetical protein
MALVAVSYDKQYRDPLVMKTGDELKILKWKDDEWPGWIFCESQSGKQGWVPENMIKVDADNAIAKQNYEASEVSVMEGEIVRIEKVEGGWAWVTNMTDETGWVPLRNLKIVE